MKYAKKLFAAAMVLAMALALFAVPALAYDVTITKHDSDKAAHTYGAYQIFKGDVADGVLSNVTWGDNANSAAIITELKKMTQFASLADDATAATVAKAIGDANFAANSTEAKALAEALNKGITGSPKGTVEIAADATSGKIEGLAAGYYLVKDTANVTAEGAKTKYILQVVANVSVEEKASVPSVDKEIAETTPTKVSDYNIGDSIPYTITGTLPSTFADFATYKTFTFTDTMSNGLTPPAPTAVTVKVGNDDITSLFDVAVDGQTLTVSLKEGVDLKTAKHGTSNTAFAPGDKIVVSYSATLNDNAVIGGDGNDNTVTLTFSNNPNSDGDGETGTTPPDKTVVFTFKIVADKVKLAPNGTAITAAEYNDLTPEQKANYVKVGNEYKPVQPLAGAGFTLYKADGTTVVKEIAAGETTSFEFSGVDAGTYILKETTVPAGYDKVADITITVTAEYDKTKNPPEITSLTCTPSDFVATMQSGTVEGNILNQPGSSLPSTGGMGTTLLYVAGAIMVLVAGVYLITKRRTNKESDR